MIDIPVLIGLIVNVILLLFGAWWSFWEVKTKWLRVFLICAFLSGAGFIIYGIDRQHDEVAIFHKK